MRKAQTVFVRNNGGDPFSDRYDGEDFTIEPGKAVEMEADCAKLVFGFGEEDKSRAIQRLGWAPTSADMKTALARLNAFSFHLSDPSDEPVTVQSASSSAPAGDAGGAGESVAEIPAPNDRSPAPIGAHGRKESDEVVVRQDATPRKSVNALANIARVATNAAG